MEIDSSTTHRKYPPFYHSFISSLASSFNFKPHPQPTNLLTIPSAWFPTLTFLELVYHLPLTLWAIPALLRNDPRIPLALLVFGLETSLTTLVCLAEMLSWGELSAAQRGLEGLGGMYGGYLATGEFYLLFPSRER